MFTWPSSRAAGSTSAYTGPPGSTGETQRLSRPSSAAVLVTRKTKTSCKRKSTTDESTEGQRRQSRRTPSPTEEHKHTTRGSSSSTETPASIISETERKKRKSEKTAGPRKKSRKTPSPSEGPSHQATTETSSNDQPGTSPNSRAAFKAKYKEEKLLGEGGYGTVFAGYRQDDNMPVAIKHIPKVGVKHISILLEGKSRMVPMEVALLLKLKPAAPGTSAVVSLLDWYSLDYELILVLERPVPCTDLVDFINSRQSALQEHEAKIITKQLVDALIAVHSKGVFHRDIKLDNILIETGSDVPRVRLIDFGCGTFLSGGKYMTEQGTYWYTSPEWFLRGWYKAGPSTVWQLGVVLFAMLHRYLPFNSSSEMISDEPHLSDSLTDDCHGFLRSCLIKSPEERATLETLKHHPWLGSLVDTASTTSILQPGTLKHHPWLSYTDPQLDLSEPQIDTSGPQVEPSRQHMDPPESHVDLSGSGIQPTRTTTSAIAGPTRTTYGPLRAADVHIKSTDGPLKAIDGPTSTTDGPLRATEGPPTTTAPGSMLLWPQSRFPLYSNLPLPCVKAEIFCVESGPGFISVRAYIEELLPARGVGVRSM
ncbi:serine/threonine-protein kinase prk-2-like [Centropristis striata]|uniref:serine/threonine-protein kinase prk-2-like n=1 Tax=Centropristis striata TaxID=184440 RepID=UPI0027E0E568|nr:serine/threonine-protein kinase prk-2-like [Centropristis striata]